MDTTVNNERFKPLIAAEFFPSLVESFKETLGKVVIEKVSKIPGVEEKIEEQKIEVGKTLLWKYIPFILIGTALTFLIVRFK